MSTKITGQPENFKPLCTMGVASPSTKRRLEAPEGDEIISAKIAKRQTPEVLSESDGQNENSSDFLTTSILARTLLTSSSTPTGCYAPLTSLDPLTLLDPLESLKSSLEALPAPAALDSLIIDGPTFISPSKTTIHEPNELEFTSLMCHERPLATTITVLSPIDEWNPRKNSVNGLTGSSSLHQVITEDENGKSYFNLGSADATIVARKTSPVWTNNYTSNNNNNNNNNSDFDDNASSSSCESISSEDLFNSGEEFDGSDDDEDELSSYKQQRSTVLHLSLCKLNKFRSQQCVEPSLHRSVLICNTLRYIEQEIKNEDEVDESLKSREKLPSFWRSSSNHCFSNTSNPSNHSSQPQITDSRPISSGQDPYLSPSPYTNNNNNNSINGTESPYLYDYNSLRPTPYHTTSYEYEHDLPSNVNVNANSTPLSNTPNNNSDVPSSAAASTLLECDSGYGEDLDLTSYYYGASPPGPLLTSTGASLQQSPPRITSPPHSLTDSLADSLVSSVADSSYLHCGFSSSIPQNHHVHSQTDKVGGLSPPQSESESILLVESSSSEDSDINDIKSPTSSSVSTSLTVTCHPTTANNDYHLTNGSSSSSSSSNSIGSQEQDQMCWTTSSSSSSTKMSTGLSQMMMTPPVSPGFAQQDSQCGMESRRSDLSHGFNLPMDSLISSTYSSSL